MLEKGKISPFQAFLLNITLILPTFIIGIPSIAINIAKQDAWISMILSTLVGLLIVLIVVNLNLRFPGKTLFEYSEVILGKVLGKLVSFLYFVWFLHVNVIIIREFSSFMVITVMPDTPMIIFYIVTVAVAAYLVYSGLEVLSRFCQLFVPLLLTLILLTFILSIKDMKLTRLLPVMDTGLVPILGAAAVSTSWIGEIVLFSMFIPYLNKQKKAKQIGILAMLFTGIFGIISILISLAAFGPNLAGYWLYPVFNAVRMISFANFLERLESILITGWVLGGFAKISIFYYATVLGGAQCFGQKNYRPLIVPVGVILIVLSSFLHQNTAEIFDFMVKAFTPYYLPSFEIGIPLILLIIALIRRKGEKTN